MTPLDPLQSAALLLVLLVIGWGIGLAALAWRGLRPGAPLTGLALAALVGAGSAYGYARVLTAVGLLHACDLVTAAGSGC